MALETGTFISDLVATNPPSNDPKSEGDNHIRLIKSTVKNTFPNVDGAVTASPGELNILDGATLDTAELNVLDGVTASTAEINLLDGVTSTTDEINSIHLKANIDSPTLTGTPRAPTGAAGSGGTQIATHDYVNSTILNVSLPGQAGNAGALMQTDGTNANWTKTINGGVVKLLSGGDIVGTTEAQSISNKTINQKDALFTLQDDADLTKQAKFECSSIATGTTRIITFPNEDITLGESPKKLLQTFTLSANSLNWDIIPTIDDKYDVYEFEFYKLTNVNALSQTLYMRFRVGSTFISTVTYYGHLGGGATNSISLEVSTNFSTCIGAGNIGNYMAGNIKFYLPSSTIHKKVAYIQRCQSDSLATGSTSVKEGKMSLDNLGALTGFQFFTDSMGLGAGAVGKWYGLK
jgi:hypothetical protein